MHQHLPEMPNWADYMDLEVQRLGLQPELFPASRGDLFIWDALLLHGGSEIANSQLSRQSLVTHYWTQTDCVTRGLDLRPAPGGWWAMRAPQPVPSLLRPETIPADQYRLGDDDLLYWPEGKRDLRSRMHSPIDNPEPTY